MGPILTQGLFVPEETLSNVWRPCWLLQLGAEVHWHLAGQRPGLLLTSRSAQILTHSTDGPQCTGQTHGSRDGPQCMGRTTGARDRPMVHGTDPRCTDGPMVHGTGPQCTGLNRIVHRTGHSAWDGPTVHWMTHSNGTGPRCTGQTTVHGTGPRCMGRAHSALDRPTVHGTWAAVHSGLTHPAQNRPQCTGQPTAHRMDPLVHRTAHRKEFLQPQMSVGPAKETFYREFLSASSKSNRILSLKSWHFPQ